MLKEKFESLDNPVLIGKGAFSKVYRVTNSSTGEFLACKGSCRLDLAEREAKLLERLKHPLFPGYKGSMLQEETHYLLMEYICGEHLGQYVRKRGKLSVKRAVEIAVELAKGLMYLHEQSDPVVFRDIKPENVMIQQDGRIRLIDFGCVYMPDKQDNGMAGSRGYAAPEQFEARASVGMESDVYAMGMLLYFMLTGQVLKKEGERIAPQLRWQKLPHGLKQLIKWSTQESPGRRIPDMRTFVQLLAAYEEKNPLKYMLLYRRSSFQYQKNIRKGL